jgi:Rad3-related DNA helicase
MAERDLDDNDFFIQNFVEIQNYLFSITEFIFKDEALKYEIKMYENRNPLSLVGDTRYREVRYCLNFRNVLLQEIEKIKSMTDYLHTSEWIADKTIENYTIEKEENGVIQKIHKKEVTSVSFKPIDANHIFKQICEPKAEKFLFMSATVNKQKISESFDIPLDDIYEIELDSPFPVENRIVLATSLFQMSYSKIEQSKPAMIKFLDELLSIAEGQRVVVHSGNYALANYIERESKHKHRLIVPTSHTREELIENEFKTRKDAVLVSPSIIEGVSFDDDLCRVQVIVKVPFLSLADRRTKYRNEKYPNWYVQDASDKITQGAGRGVRHKEDFCLTIILDAAFDNLFFSPKKLFSKWFRKSVRYLKDKSPENIKDTLKEFMKRI